MKCGNCNQDIDRPLELYDGRWCCPHCKKDVFPDTDTELEINALNRELFVRSEEYYFKWLTSSNEDKRTRFKYLDKAVNLCYEAAFMFHPSALMRMGYYYDRGYVDFNTGSAERWRVAYFYYKAVLFNVHRGVHTPEGDDRYVDELTDIKLQCAGYLIDMLKNVPREIAVKRQFDGYESLDELRAALAEKITDLGGDYDKFELLYGERAEDEDAASVAFATLRSCTDEERAPVFGIFKLSKEECVRLFSEEDNGFSVLESIGRDLRLKMAKAYDDKEIDGKFYELKNSNAVAQYVSDCPDSGVYMCFVNARGGHKYLKKRTIAGIAKCLEDNGNADIKRLIKAGRYNSCVFYDDDFYKYSEKGRTSKKETDKFVSDVCEEEKN